MHQKNESITSPLTKNVVSADKHKAFTPRAFSPSNENNFPLPGAKFMKCTNVPDFLSPGKTPPLSHDLLRNHL